MVSFLNKRIDQALRDFKRFWIENNGICVPVTILKWLENMIRAGSMICLRYEKT